MDTLINVDKDRREDWHFNNIYFFFQDFLTFAWVKKIEVKFFIKVTFLGHKDWICAHTPSRVQILQLPRTTKYYLELFL